MAESNKKIKRPSLLWSLTEASRAIIEFGAYYPYKMLNKIPKSGDGHPVIFLPGFLASDKSTVPLRKFVYNLGYQVYGWGSGRNLADVKNLELLLDRIENLYHKYDNKVSIVGWSLGGVFARQIAKERPHLVRQVITMGSPFKGITKPNNAKWIHNIITKGEGTARIDPALIADLPMPAPVPTTAIYSKEDGIVPWQVCLEEHETAIHQNIQVRGSHLGMGVNPSILYIIADRLQYHEDNWIHFKPNRQFRDALIYPSLNKNVN